MALEKNTMITATIESLGANGEGIARINGETVFIPFTLPAEKVTAKIIADKKTYAFAKLLTINAPADERAREECPAFIKCGGCQLQHMKYKDQLAFKTIVVKDCLKKIAKIDFDVPLCSKSELKYKYRNKLQLPVGMTSDNNIIVGFYANCSHRIIDISNCPLHPDWNSKIIDIIKKFMSKYAISGYNEATGKGIIRHIVARQVGKIMQIIIVINSNDLEFKTHLISKLQDTFENPSIFLNINMTTSNVVLGNEFIHLAGERTVITTELQDNKFPLSPDSFLQINSSVKNKLYAKAVELSDVTGNDIVIDAYSGVGIMTSLFASKCKHAYGIEIVPNAITNAKTAAHLNFLDNQISYIQGDCDVELENVFKIAKNDNGKTILVLDPPRKGVSNKVIDSILKNLPEKIVYISCNPSTLARDISMLCGTAFDNNYKSDTPKYELNLVQPFDMFPQTKHVECLVVLNKI